MITNPCDYSNYRNYTMEGHGHNGADEFVYLKHGVHEEYRQSREGRGIPMEGEYKELLYLFKKGDQLCLLSENYHKHVATDSGVFEEVQELMVCTAQIMGKQVQFSRAFQVKLPNGMGTHTKMQLSDRAVTGLMALFPGYEFELIQRPLDLDYTVECLQRLNYHEAVPYLYSFIELLRKYLGPPVMHQDLDCLTELLQTATDPNEKAVILRELQHLTNILILALESQ